MFYNADHILVSGQDCGMCALWVSWMFRVKDASITIEDDRRVTVTLVSYLHNMANLIGI